jgi:hypothetical protein
MENVNAAYSCQNSEQQQTISTYLLNPLGQEASSLHRPGRGSLAGYDVALLEAHCDAFHDFQMRKRDRYQGVVRFSGATVGISLANASEQTGGPGRLLNHNGGTRVHGEHPLKTSEDHITYRVVLPQHARGVRTCHTFEQLRSVRLDRFKLEMHMYTRAKNVTFRSNRIHSPHNMHNIPILLAGCLHSLGD